jgi:hypothetical protein
MFRSPYILKLRHSFISLSVQGVIWVLLCTFFPDRGITYCVFTNIRRNF